MARRALARAATTFTAGQWGIGFSIDLKFLQNSETISSLFEKIR